MSRIIRVCGLDPSLANLGIARFDLDLDDLHLSLTGLRLVTTAPAVRKKGEKKVRVNSDDLSRARKLHEGMLWGIKDATWCIAEIPSGAQSARAQLGFGIVTGLMATLDIDLIEVQPVETKLASVGTKTASKKQVIEWATNLYPDGGWLRERGTKNGSLILANEHLADACAVVHAGLQTNQFLGLYNLFGGKHQLQREIALV